MAGHPCPGPLVWDMLAADLSSGEWRSLERHLRVCPRCMEMLATGRAGTKASPAEIERVEAGADHSDGGSDDPATVSAAAAGASPKAERATTGIDGQSADQAEEPPLNGAGELAPPGRRPGRWAVAALGIVIVAAALVLAPVRSAAAGLLSQFRVHQIRAVAVDPGSMGAFEALASELDQIITLERVNGVSVEDGDVAALDQSGVVQEVGGLADAQAFMGFAPRLPEALGAPLAVEVAPGGEYRFRVDGTKIAAWASAAGVETDGLPTSVGYVDVTAKPGLIAQYRSTSGTVSLHQVPVPEIALPAGWDLAALGELYLRSMGVSQYQSRALASTIDWGSTLVVPFPAAQSEALDVKVDGVDGVAFVRHRWKAQPETLDSAGSEGAGYQAREEEPRSVVVWQRDGMLYAVSGDLDPSALVAIAEDLS